MAMTKKDYEMVARALNAAALYSDKPYVDGRAVVHFLIGYLGSQFKGDNPRFDVDRFKAAALKDVS